MLAEPAHHPSLYHWVTATVASVKPELTDRLLDAEFLWRSSRADFLVPGRPGATLSDDLDSVDHIADAWRGVQFRLAADARHRSDLLARHGPAAAPAAEPAEEPTISLEVVQRRLVALAHPVRLRSPVRATNGEGGGGGSCPG